MQDAFSRAIQFIWKNVGNDEKPENLFKWCQLAKVEVSYDKQARALQEGIKQRLKKIEELKAFTTLEKVKLVFLFSIPISAKFLKELEDGGCIVNLNTRNVIALFRSSDNTVVLESTHATNNRNFKGKKEFDEVKIEKERVRETNLEMEEVLEEVEWIGHEDLILEGNTREQTPGTISLLKLFEQVEILSKKKSVYMRSSSKKQRKQCVCARQMIRLEWIFRYDIKQLIFQTLSIHEFNAHFNSMMTSLRRGTTRHSNENSMKMAKLVKEFQKNLIAPFGRGLVDAVQVPDDKVTRREEMILLKTVAIKLDGFMNIISNCWTDLD